MIYVTQGHELGIGIEVFFKALLAKKELAPHLHFVGFESSIAQTLNSCNIKFSLTPNHIIFSDFKVSTTFLSNHHPYTESLAAMLHTLEIIQKDDTLFTLPTSKDQLFYNNLNYAGHTEFLRSYFNDNNLIMSFWGPSHLQFLLTDHIPLKNISSTLTPKYFFTKMFRGISEMVLHHPNITNIYIAGINPHAGEEGVLGEEELLLTPVLHKLQKEFHHLNISDFISGDTLHTYKADNSLFIYMYHDQGLVRFKSENNFIGTNATLGLPFLRVSVDHGTAFSLYGHNSADYSGVLYTLEQITKKNE